MTVFPTLAALLVLVPTEPTIRIIAEPQQVRPGESVLLSWSCPKVPKVRLEPGGLILPGQSQVTLRPSYTTVYHFFDAMPGGPELGQAEVRITPGMPLGEPARICAFDASARTVLPGDPVVLKWECAGSSKVRLEPGGLELDGKSEVTVTPLESTRYTLTAHNAAGGQSRTLEVGVLGRSVQVATPMVCTFGASKSIIKPGEQVELHWVCQGDAKVRLEPGGLELDGQSSVAVVPDKTTVYTLSVSSLSGGSSRSLEVQVEAPRRVLTEKDLVDPEEVSEPRDWTDLPGTMRRGEAMRDSAPEGSWTMRLVVSGPAAGLTKVAKAAGPKVTEILVIPYPRKDGFRFWQACYGVFPSRAEALKAWRQAPESLRKPFADALPKKLLRPQGNPRMAE